MVVAMVEFKDNASDGTEKAVMVGRPLMLVFAEMYRDGSNNNNAAIDVVHCVFM